VTAAAGVALASDLTSEPDVEPVQGRCGWSGGQVWHLRRVWLYAFSPVTVCRMRLSSGHLVEDAAGSGGDDMGERWETVEEIAAALRRFETGISGWQSPRAYGVGRLGEGGQVEFARIDLGDHPLPGVVLATVCGHQAGSASYLLDAAALLRAIDLLAPAEGCRAYDHPNLMAWRQLHGQLDVRDTVIAVFAGDQDGMCDDPHVRALRTHLPTDG
jgi:hypothetical protein